MRRVLVYIVGLCTTLALLSGTSAAASAKSLKIYFIDVEGGQATLLVSPSGQSLLIDTGGFNGARDAGRIVATAREAGLKQIDYVMITHYHVDHYGGVPQLVDRIKVGTFLDHGVRMEGSDVDPLLYAAYAKAIADHPHIAVKPGWVLPIKGIEVRVVTSGGAHIVSPLAGAGEANPYCATQPPAVTDYTENARSVGVLITYGHFRFLDLGDLTKKKEIALVCPDNLVGTVDLLLVSHHGLDLSSSKALVWALHSRVAVFDNGAHKGANPAVWQIVHDAPGLEDIWQLHYAEGSDLEHNVAADQIVNLKENDQGKGIEVSAQSNGTFTETNERTGTQKTYPKK